jgi:hypothetical protein
LLGLAAAGAASVSVALPRTNLTGFERSFEWRERSGAGSGRQTLFFFDKQTGREKWEGGTVSVGHNVRVGVGANIESTGACTKRVHFVDQDQERRESPKRRKEPNQSVPPGPCRWASSNVRLCLPSIHLSPSSKQNIFIQKSPSY